MTGALATVTVPGPPLTLAAAAAGVSGVDLIFWFLTALSGLVILVLTALTLVYCIRYRAGSHAPRSTARPGMTLVEITWLSATLVVFLAIGAWANMAFSAARTPPLDAYTVYVVGKQWMWKAEHPGGRREIDELHVPVGQPVRLVLASDDVIHSFFIPDYRVKQDVVPGRFTSLWFTPTQPGEHRLMCSQYCGTEHSSMIGRIRALPAADFGRWLSDRPVDEKAPGMPRTPQAPLARGQALFYRLGCSACHVQTASVLAPRLDGLWGRPTKLSSGREIIVDENYIRESILDPNARIAAGYAAPSLMPSFAGTITEEQIAELVEFIRSIRFGWPDEQGDNHGGSGPP
jgi:cytochrome c oxidase subunit 2